MVYAPLTICNQVFSSVHLCAQKAHIGAAEQPLQCVGPALAHMSLEGLLCITNFWSCTR